MRMVHEIKPLRLARHEVIGEQHIDPSRFRLQQRNRVGRMLCFKNDVTLVD